MIRMDDRERMDDGGDYYCALGWAFALGKDGPVDACDEEREIFASCAGAAIYRREVFEEIGMFDEKHFAYLEDIDIGYRSKIYGYRNWYLPGPKCTMRAAEAQAHGTMNLKSVSPPEIMCI